MRSQSCFRLLLSLTCLMMLVWATGCASAEPETWSQATTRRYRVPVQGRHAAAPFQSAPWSAALDTYPFKEDYKPGSPAHVDDPSHFDLAMRNPDFPRTYLSVVYVDLTGPDHPVYLEWQGPSAASCPRGPWRSSPGRGTGEYDCDSVKDSNTNNSNCTPKGVFRVKGFSDHLYNVPLCLYATWVVQKPRFIALHSSGDIPEFPASGGCIRLPHEAAKLIHNNSITGVTLVKIQGKWEAGNY
jgi:hypothetical protein